MANQFTDRFGTPIATGDRVVLCFGTQNGGAHMSEHVVAGIIPLVPHRNARSEFDFMREDQRNQGSPTHFRRAQGSYQQPTAPDPSKLFVLQYEQFQSGYGSRPDKTVKRAYDRVCDVIKVP